MIFTTGTFIFVFFPLSVAVYFILQRWMAKKENFTIGNIILIAFGMIFYAWGTAINLLVLVAYSFMVYFLGLIIFLLRKRGDVRKRIAIVVLVVSIILSVFVFWFYRYPDISKPFITTLFPHIGRRIANLTIPIGISFLTFSAISYYVDIYKNEASGKSLLNCFLYMTFFPKIASGPIVLWKDFEPQIKNHPTSLDSFVSGMNRMIVGLAKKLIIADTFGVYVSRSADGNVDIGTAWLVWLLYGLEIYFDFSGYSDISLGLAKIFGFNFKENFNFPYRSTSVSEFWRRWHISLGSFFKQYVYIPLGGNRKGLARTVINLAVVFFLTGIWHGAGAAFLLWGGLHGACVISERLLKEKAWYKKIPTIVKWLLTFFVIISAWQIFRFGDIQNVGMWFSRMFGAAPDGMFIMFSLPYYLDARLITILIIALAGSILLGDNRVQSAVKKMNDRMAFYVVKEAGIVLLFMIVLIYIVNSTYKPFIYFQF